MKIKLVSSKSKWSKKMDKILSKRIQKVFIQLFIEGLGYKVERIQ